MENSDDKKTIYCNKCGKEMPQDAKYCKACGATLEFKEMKYVKRQGSGNGGKKITFIMGGFFILTAILILVGGGTLMGVTGIFDQGGGYVGIENVNFETNTQMLIWKQLDIIFDDYNSPPNWLWEPNIGDLVSIKIKADSNTGDNIFIGVVETSDTYAVLGEASYDQITQFRMDDFRDIIPDITYRHNPGETLTVAPTDLDIWVAEVSGSGEQTLTWSPEKGTYWLVIMNEDGSVNVDVDAGVSVKMPILDYVGKGLLIGGLMPLGVGVTIVYLGAIKPRY
jgi:hypothetical protein